MSESNNTTTVEMSETEINMLIENLIEDLGTVPKAFAWVNRKVAEIKHELLSRGEQTERENLKTWESVYNYFERNYRSYMAINRYTRK
jgi:hypothetical protein